MSGKISEIGGVCCWKTFESENILKRRTYPQNVSTLAFVTNDVILCVADSTKCGHPAVPVNSRVSLSNEDLKPGTIATYSCDIGYELLG